MPSPWPHGPNFANWLRNGPNADFECADLRLADLLALLAPNCLTPLPSPS